MKEVLLVIRGKDVMHTVLNIVCTESVMRQFNIIANSLVLEGNCLQRKYSYRNRCFQ